MRKKPNLMPQTLNWNGKILCVNKKPNLPHSKSDSVNYSSKRRLFPTSFPLKLSRYLEKILCRCGNNCFTSHWPFKFKAIPHPIMAFRTKNTVRVALWSKITYGLSGEIQKKFLPGLGSFPDPLFQLFHCSADTISILSLSHLFLQAVSNFWIIKESVGWHKSVWFFGKRRIWMWIRRRAYIKDSVMEWPRELSTNKTPFRRWGVFRKHAVRWVIRETCVCPSTLSADCDRKILVLSLECDELGTMSLDFWKLGMECP